MLKMLFSSVPGWRVVHFSFVCFSIPYPFREKKNGFGSQTVWVTEEADGQTEGRSDERMDRRTHRQTDRQTGK